jgi:hypothetical protein
MRAGARGSGDRLRVMSYELRVTGYRQELVTRYELETKSTRVNTRVKRVGKEE